MWACKQTTLYTWMFPFGLAELKFPLLVVLPLCRVLHLEIECRSGAQSIRFNELGFPLRETGQILWVQGLELTPTTRAGGMSDVDIVPRSASTVLTT